MSANAGSHFLFISADGSRFFFFFYSAGHQLVQKKKRNQLFPTNRVHVFSPKKNKQAPAAWWQCRCCAPRRRPLPGCSCAALAAGWPRRTPARETTSYGGRPPSRPAAGCRWRPPSSGWTPPCWRWSRTRRGGRTFLPPSTSSGPGPSSGPVPSSTCCRRCPKVCPVCRVHSFL